MIPLHQFKAYFGLNWNPFLPDVPTTALMREDSIERFCWEVEQLVLDGGFALVDGEAGLGKSSVMRILDNRLSQIPELCVRKLQRPQSRIRDFYREMGAEFGIDVQASNRFGGFLRLREQWLSQISNHMFRPVLLIDEAQEVPDEVLSELRLLGSTDLDARCIVAVIFAGDSRFLGNLRSPAALPLRSRIRVRFSLEGRSGDAMQNMLVNAIRNAGNPDLMTPGVIRALAEQHLGNPRAMMISANSLLTAAMAREAKQIDENLYFEVTRSSSKKRRSTSN